MQLEPTGPPSAGATVYDPKIAIIVPTLNAAKHWPTLSNGLLRQTATISEILIVDSESTDGTPELALSAGFRLLPILRADFNHGATRQLAAAVLDTFDILIYLTQDVDLVAPDAVERLVAPFADLKLGAAYGRQLARTEANPIEAHARLFNYPAQSAIRVFEDRLRLGLRVAFLSNSFAAYRRTALLAAGGFPSDTIMAEDTLVAARLLLDGWKTAYVAEAAVVHSHPYSIAEEFRRYFDTGVYHTRKPWLLEQFGTAGSEGRRFVLSELQHLGWRRWFLIPSALLRTLAKLIGYHLGLHEDKLSPTLRRKLSMHKGFWQPAPHPTGPKAR